ncbi:MAG: glycosyltransferase family 4 protein [Frankiaceae bacterium]
MSHTQQKSTSGKIRVLFTQSHSDFTAVSHVHSLLMRGFDPERVEVHVACIPENASGVPESLRILREIPNVRIRPTRFGPSLYRRSKRDIATSAVRDGLRGVASLAGLTAYIKRHRIDVVHFSERPRDAVYGLAGGRAAGARTVFHLHSEPADWMSSRSRWAMREADGLICVSQHTARLAVAQGRMQQHTYAVLNGLDLAHWRPTTDGTPVRAEFGIPADALVLSITSRVVPSKGHEQLLDALARLQKRIPPFRLIIAGADDPAVLPPGFSQTDALRAQARRLGIADRVIFAGGRDDVREILAASDIYAMPSLDEAFGLAFIEAMAMELPVVALRAGGTAEIVAHGESGLLSAPGDPDRLAENIAQLADNPPMRRAMGRAGRARVERRFSAARMAREVEDVYLALLSPRGFQRRSGENGSCPATALGTADGMRP